MEWRGREEADLAHARACQECAQWVQASERRRSALTDLVRLSAPAELDGRVEQEFAGDRSRRLERVLCSLVRLGAPVLLDERVAQTFPRRGDEDRGRRKAAAMSALEVRPAPRVLERLVNEELADPERHQAERFSGGLERVSAPAVLEQRLAALVRRRALARLVLGPLVTLAAAGLVIWFALGHRSEPRRRFEVIHATSLHEIDPIARMLAESLNGAPPR